MPAGRPIGETQIPGRQLPGNSVETSVDDDMSLWTVLVDWWGPAEPLVVNPDQTSIDELEPTAASTQTAAGAANG